MIVGQQITLGFAFTLRERLVRRSRRAGGRRALRPPTAEAVANLDVEALMADQFSRRKAEYLIGAARRSPPASWRSTAWPPARPSAWRPSCSPCAASAPGRRTI